MEHAPHLYDSARDGAAGRIPASAPVHIGDPHPRLEDYVASRVWQVAWCGVWKATYSAEPVAIPGFGGLTGSAPSFTEPVSRKCTGCDVQLRLSDPDLCERCDLHAARR